MDSYLIEWFDRTYTIQATYESAMAFIREHIQEHLNANPDNLLSVQEALELADEWKVQRESEIPFAIPRNADDCHPIALPTEARSLWGCYMRNLEAKGWTSVSRIALGTVCARICASIMMSARDAPIRELAIGQVQSGKTASMAGVIALAMDNGYDIVVVLSGTIESLRQQTEERLRSDLNGITNLNVNYRSNLSNSINYRPDQLLGHNRRVLTVCLKNSTRLNNLHTWIRWTLESGHDTRVLVIDDESDQGGINTRDIAQPEATAINRLLKSIVFANPKRTSYLAYTATPYANVLNEPPEGGEGKSLYPRHRIHILSPGSGYFGCEEIFGRDPDEDGEGGLRGLPMQVGIPKEDVSAIRQIHVGSGTELPPSLQDAVLWFICCVAIRRSPGWTRAHPTSMMVHTSHRQIHHKNMSIALRNFIEELPPIRQNLLAKLRPVWDRMWCNWQQLGTRAIPAIDDLDFDFLRETLEGVPVIDGVRRYSRGIHLCTDNSSSPATRLAYPDREWDGNFSPCFVVVGGNTLSRGLTLEGLVSTYFLRTAGASDTLMQMGRWFGYRRGYEDLPRVWTTEESASQYRFIARVEHELRDNVLSGDIHSPAEMGPAVLTDPDVIKITASNRMQAATNRISFAGKAPQTIYFPRDSNLLQENIALVKDFAERVVCTTPQWRGGNIIFRGIPAVDVFDFILKFNFCDDQRTFNDSDMLVTWLSGVQGRLHWLPWNVVFVGRQEGAGLEIRDFTWRKSTRSGVWEHEKKHESRLYIKALRGPGDLWLDLDPDLGGGNLEARRRYLKETMQPQPLMLLYLIDKSSKCDEGDAYSPEIKPRLADINGDRRYNLDAPEDLVGMSLVWPGGESLNESYVTIDLSRFGRLPSEPDIDDADEVLSGVEHDAQA